MSNNKGFGFLEIILIAWVINIAIGAYLCEYVYDQPQTDEIKVERVEE